MSAPPPESVASGNTEEDWHVYEVLCKDMNVSINLRVIIDYYLRIAKIGIYSIMY